MALQSITVEAAQYALDVVHKTYTKLNKNKRRNPEALETFLSSEFSAPQNKPKSSVNEPPPLSEVRHSSNQSALSSQAEVLGNLSASSPNTEAFPSLSVSSPTPKKKPKLTLC